MYGTVYNAMLIQRINFVDKYVILLCMHAYLSVCMSVSFSPSVSLSHCVCLCLSVCVYIYIYTDRQTQTQIDIYTDRLCVSVSVCIYMYLPYIYMEDRLVGTCRYIMYMHAWVGGGGRVGGWWER